MVMEADSSFTSHNERAKEIFEKLYGYSSNGEKTGVPFVEDYDLISQFKHELYEWDETVNGEKISQRFGCSIYPARFKLKSSIIENMEVV